MASETISFTIEGNTFSYPQYFTGKQGPEIIKTLAQVLDLKKISYRIIEDDFQPKIIIKNNTGREKMIYIPWGSGQSHIYFQNVLSNFWEVSDDERKHYNLFNIIQMIEYFV